MNQRFKGLVRESFFKSFTCNIFIETWREVMMCIKRLKEVKLNLHKIN